MKSPRKASPRKRLAPRSSKAKSEDTPQFYHHVTATADVEAILRDGLKGRTKPRNRGETLAKASIFVLVDDNEGLVDTVAINQIWPFQDIPEYAVIRIAPAGVTGKVRHDAVAERTAPWHRVIEQDRIDPAHLTLAKVRKLDWPGKALEALQDKLAKVKWSAEEWELARKYFDPSMIGWQTQWELALEDGELSA